MLKMEVLLHTEHCHFANLDPSRKHWIGYIKYELKLRKDAGRFRIPWVGGVTSRFALAECYTETTSLS